MDFGLWYGILFGAVGPDEVCAERFAGIRMKLAKGFTLIELLVVIAIIALLLAIIMPGLREAKKQARKIICRSNLHQWGLTHITYAGDNDNKLLVTIKRSPDITTMGRHPGEIWLDSQGGAANRPQDEISFELIGPYMPGFDTEDLKLDGIWKCPSNNSDTSEETYTRIQQDRYFRTEYSYFARRDRWLAIDFMSRPGDIAGRNLRSTNVIMADFILYWNGIVLFNHGEEGPSTHDKGYHLWSTDGIPKISGVNRLYGDGHVRWKDRNEFDLPQMELGQYPNTVEPFVRGESMGVGTFY